MNSVQPAILAAAPRHAQYLSFSLQPDAAAESAARALADATDRQADVVGFGRSFVLALGAEIDGLRSFPHYAQAGIVVPSTPAAAWVWLRGDDRGELLHRGRTVEKVVANSLRLEQRVHAFQYRDSRDLTGYEDGTENPKGDRAIETALVAGRGPGLDGSSFVAVQQWIHDLDRFDGMTATDQDNSIGRRKSDNRELADAPESAHVKRTAQESFEPQAFVLRRSMPWADERQAGLMFVAFGRSFDAFEAQLNRMVGAEDGIRDALFRFTRPVTGGYFWCPPVAGGGLDLRALGL